MGWRGENSFQTVVNFSGPVRRTAPLYVQYTSKSLDYSPRDICLKTIQLCYETIFADKELGQAIAVLLPTALNSKRH
jgi:hypothetical protein